jgi:hypothetical protein
MAFDERDYWLTRRGWNPKKLTGFRRSVQQQARDEPAYIYRPKEQLSSKAKRDIVWSIAILAIWAAAVMVWRYLL